MKKYLILLATAALACSCGDDKNVDDPQNPDPQPPVTEAAISLSATEYAFTKAGGTSDEITVTSSGAWELIGDDKVFEPSAKSGENGDKVTFTVGVNPKSEERTEVFQFLCDGEVAELTLTQSAGDELTIETKEYAAPVIGGSIYVEVKASGAYEYTVEEGADWLTKSTAEAVPSRAELVAAANDTGKARRATVTFTLGEMSVDVVVTQAQNDVLKVAEGGKIEYEVGKPAETVSFAFEANFKPAVAASADWITVGEPVAASAEEGVVAYTLSIEVAANDGEPRNGTVTIAHPENNDVEALVITIEQDGEEPLPEGAVRIPDANFRTKLLALGYIESADSEVCKVLDDGTTIPMMNVSSCQIADLTGIEVFTNITTLNVSSNPLARLDLSKNPNITNLSVNNVPNLTYVDLGEMNLSWFDPRNLQSKLLTVISRGNVKELETNGAMTEIDLSQCYNITTVKLNGCSSLTGTVDLRNCAAIKNLGLNLCSQLEKVILPKSVEGLVNISGTYNENLEITYE